jgi:hypothetical protein
MEERTQLAVGLGHRLSGRRPPLAVGHRHRSQSLLGSRLAAEQNTQTQATLIGAPSTSQSRSFLTADMSTFKLSTSFPADAVHVFLFTEVLNAIQLRERLLAGDPAYTYAFLDASMVRDA